MKLTIYRRQRRNLQYGEPSSLARIFSEKKYYTLKIQLLLRIMGSRISQKEALQNLERCLQGTKPVMQKHIVDFQKRKKEEKRKENRPYISTRKSCSIQCERSLTRVEIAAKLPSDLLLFAKYLFHLRQKI